MNLPDSVTILQARRRDEYANPGGSFEDPARAAVKGFLVKPDTLLLPPTAVLRKGDRLETRGRLYEALEVVEVRSPAKTVLWTATVKEIPR